MNKNQYYFHVPWRKTATILVAILTFAIYFSISPETLSNPQFKLQVISLLLINLIAPLLGIWFISTIHIHESGITLYRVNKLKWPDITDAYTTKSLGINIIRIKRKKGMPWSLPLYFVGSTTIKEALIKHSPNSSIIYKVANELPST